MRLSSEKAAPSYTRRQAQKPRRGEETLDRRKMINKSFVKSFLDSKESSQRGGVREFSLSEIIDSKNIGKQKFAYDSQKVQNFDEVNVKKAREGAKEILSIAIEKAKNKAVQIRSSNTKPKRATCS